MEMERVAAVAVLKFCLCQIEVLLEEIHNAISNGKSIAIKSLLKLYVKNQKLDYLH